MLYEHNKDQLLYGVFFYLLLSFAANSYLWTMGANTALSCV
jgi:hypothetical protein